MRNLEGFYDIIYDEPRRLLHVRTYGFWTLEVVNQFADDIAQVRKIVGSDCDSLVNSMRGDVHSAEVTHELARLTQSKDHMFDGRVALVISSALLKMQNRRYMNDDHYGYFDSETEAITWLEAAREKSA